MVSIDRWGQGDTRPSTVLLLLFWDKHGTECVLYHFSSLVCLRFSQCSLDSLKVFRG